MSATNSSNKLRGNIKNIGIDLSMVDSRPTTAVMMSPSNANQ